MALISVCTPSIRIEGLKVVQESLKNQTFQGFEWLTEIGIPERGHDLNASYNRMLKRAKGNIFLSWQDYIQAPPDILQRIVEYYEKNKVFFTCIIAKTKDWKEKEYDWRKYREGRIASTEWEIDFGGCPMEYIKKIGGFDEELDKGWTFDNVNVGIRAELEGYSFGLCPVEVTAFDHDEFEKHPFREKMNPDLHNERLEQFRHGLRLENI